MFAFCFEEFVPMHWNVKALCVLFVVAVVVCLCEQHGQTTTATTKSTHNAY